ncbi:MAG: phosphomannomutase/phosphoglucomutase [Nanoarchaeota archaeon]|nr:phosphomannomutase/phosphoglucomutase [Nanoarchaeota archaeon]MBU1321533.1 phosphomannomutase/phosphoglucomutase [Nanoarchaeota archaeon]MBU1597157.1 phosphomannomutase/phosphoglucomutase [Nanoarchaeota archaeon]MBU2441158.1 phosphomannomutase/phosphoglucomutase [Nanoarchaeota archaeon]
MSDINIKVFKAYDVRGIYPSDLSEKEAAAAAKALAFFLQADNIVIGRDARTSSPAIHKAVVDALVDVGVDVYDIGLCSTPMLYYAIAKKGFAGGIMITASHNPPEYNALKMVKHPNIQLSSPGDMDEIRKLVVNDAIVNEVKEKKGKVQEFEILDEYVEELSEKFSEVKGLKVVVDYGNGMGSINAKPVFEKLDIEVIPLFEEIDCTFPNHPANPHDLENFDDLRKKVVEEKADLGIFFDGDADRCYCVDDTGEIVFTDILIGILIPYELKGRSDKRVYYDLRFSKIIEDVLKENHGQGTKMRVGNPFYKKKLTEEGGVFGAELSGHIIFQDHYAIDDGLYAALKVMKVLVQSRKKLSELAKPLQKYFSSPEFNFRVKNPNMTLGKLRHAFPDGKNLEIDGLYVEYPDWWFSLRKSNTEPIVRLRLEADTKEKLDEMKEKIISMIK